MASLFVFKYFFMNNNKEINKLIKISKKNIFSTLNKKQINKKFISKLEKESLLKKKSDLIMTPKKKEEFIKSFLKNYILFNQKLYFDLFEEKEIIIRRLKEGIIRICLEKEQYDRLKRLHLMFNIFLLPFNEFNKSIKKSRNKPKYRAVHQIIYNRNW